MRIPQFFAFTFALSLLCTASLSAQTASTTSSLANKETFKIGLALCLSGVCAEAGQNAQRGAELAAREINEKGGVLGRKIEFAIQDTREAVSAAEAVGAFRQMRTDSGIKYFVGPTWSVAALALAPIASKMQDIIMTSPSAGLAEFNEAGDNLFNVWPHDDVGTRALARYSLKQGWKTAAVFSSQHPWCLNMGRVFADEFKINGGIISTVEEPLPDASELNAELLRIVKSKPDVVFMSNYLKMGLAADKLRKLNYKGQIITILMDRTQVEISAGALNGALYVAYPAAEKSFSERYAAQYKTNVGVCSDTGYDVIKLYARSIEEAKTFDVEKVKGILLHQHYVGASGEIVFDDKGGVRKTPTLFRITADGSEAMGTL